MVSTRSGDKATKVSTKVPKEGPTKTAKQRGTLTKKSKAAAPSSPSTNSNPYSASGSPYSPENKRKYGGGNNTPNAPIVPQASSPGGTPITLISNLNLYQNGWTIKARVVSKSDIRTWSYPKGEGSLFSIDLLDKSGIDIRVTMFKGACDKFYNFFQVGQVYTISGGRIKVANQKWNSCKSNYEMTLGTHSEVQLADDAGDIQQHAFEFTKISNLEQVEPNKMVDVIGIVREISDVQSLTSKKTGREVQKSDLTLIDDTGVQVNMTLWGEQAMNASRDIGLHKVAAFRRARVGDYGGVSLSGPQGVFVEPHVPETEALQDWWRSQGSRGPRVTKFLSSQGGAGGRMDAFGDRKSVSAIKSQNLGHLNPEKGDYLTFKGNFTFFKKDKEGGAWYTACPNDKEPCHNRCKVDQTTDGNWQCARCGVVYPNCNRKWIFSGVVADDTGSTWVSLFDDQALTLFNGTTADTVFDQYENQDLYDGTFAKATYTDWILKCRVKSEMFNDEQRIKTSVVRMDPVDYVAESKEILEQLEKWQI